jgi:hypothetical protein
MTGTDAALLRDTEAAGVRPSAAKAEELAKR